MSEVLQPETEIQAAITPETVPMSEVLPQTAAVESMFTMLRGKKLLAGAAILCGATLAEVPAAPADASVSVTYLRSARVGCHANGRSNGFSAKFNFQGLKGIRVGTSAIAQGEPDGLTSPTFIPPYNNWSSWHKYTRTKTSETIAAGHAWVHSYIYRVRTGKLIKEIDFHLPAC